MTTLQDVLDALFAALDTSPGVTVPVYLGEPESFTDTPYVKIPRSTATRVRTFSGGGVEVVAQVDAFDESLSPHGANGHAAAVVAALEDGVQVAGYTVSATDWRHLDTRSERYRGSVYQHAILELTVQVWPA